MRSTYPTLLPKGVDNLKSKVRLNKVLLGYRVGLKITVKDTGMWKSMYRFLEDAKKSTGGGFSIFGFRKSQSSHVAAWLGRESELERDNEKG